MKRSIAVCLSILFVFSIFSCVKKKEKETILESGNAIAGDEGYDFRLSIEKLDFNWKIINDYINIKLSAKTSGWVGIGFNPVDEMKDAHFIIGLVKDGKVEVRDEHGISKRLHREDTAIGGTSDITNKGGIEKGEYTEITFSIPLKSSDSLDSEIDTKKKIVVLLAYGDTDRLAMQHVFRSKAAINLSNGEYDLLLKATRK